MAVFIDTYLSLKQQMATHNATLVVVSKTKPNADILELYQQGERIFGENYVQELVAKQQSLPNDIEWHFIGHLQSNKVKYIAPFVSLIHGVDSYSLLKEINKQAQKNNRIINCLLQVYIANEETKFGFNPSEIEAVLQQAKQENLTHISIKGMMGMASFTNNQQIISNEFTQLHQLFQQLKTTYNLSTLSMGMSSDYQLALQCGSNMVRIGSLILGER